MKGGDFLKVVKLKSCWRDSSLVGSEAQPEPFCLLLGDVLRGDPS